MPCYRSSFLSGSSNWSRSRSVRFHSLFGYLAICMPERRFFIRCRRSPMHYRSRSTGLRGFCFLSLSIFLSFWWDYCRRSSLRCCALSTLSSRRNTRREPTRNFPGETMLRVGGGNENTTLRKEENMLETVPMLAAEAGNIGPFIPLGFAGLGAGIGVGIVGGKAAEAVGRNPSAFGSILVMGIIGMALAEAIAIYGLIIAFIK